MDTCVYERRAEKALDSVNKTLGSQSEAMSHLVEQYSKSGYSRINLLNSLELLFQSILRGGKVVVSGIGKSFKISSKLVATLNSLSIQSAALHASEGLHGDLGIIRDNDTLIFVTASGNTPELLQLLPHIPKSIPIILLTCNRNSKLSNHPQVKSLLYADLPSNLNEESIHGIPAPTVSATLSMVLADATILALSEMLEEDALKRKKLFSMKHPGGSIGADLSHLNENFVKMATGDVASSGRSFSLNTNSSLLSLNQLRKSFDNMNSESSNFSSLVVSDDEDMLDSKALKKNSDVQNLIVPSDPSKRVSITEDELNSTSYVTESKLLKWITLYDFVVCLKADDTHIARAMSCDQIRELYRSEIGDDDCKDEIWESFHLKLVTRFKEVQL
ncbi:DEHA2C07150p [Debaryomyces hansenii CBS767]|uniref:DEHA2C07150p n=1 Tax=Debaryomyces hansenii (strain ATCC 36239 / CBS 767 / BCRC 21394 / JCM 1990 / NBRC 0083 / IGC 2968) TaxID=284592 RepID=Q6BUX6_DEBHA|nr:DEHA2C07150p [Debaryomyces hansenii CBS767]CAG86051.2 DEHA2C07150p [Debaryomyces hansenii CBS767]|eukprot:XP_457993.2 DEHA2C07150p [Debaryomyces hansenii CBS767]